MSKKPKRQVRKPAARTAPAAGTSSTPVASVTTSSISSNGNRPFEREFNPDYTPVIKDLKRIGTLAGSFFILLVVLSFFLR